MSRGAYIVQDTPRLQKKDTSFKSFICTLLIFLALCLIILLALQKWTSDKPETSPKKDEVEVIGGKHSKQVKEKIIVTVPDTTKFVKVLTTERITTPKDIHREIESRKQNEIKDISEKVTNSETTENTEIGKEVTNTARNNSEVTEKASTEEFILTETSTLNEIIKLIFKQTNSYLTSTLKNEETSTETTLPFFFTTLNKEEIKSDDFSSITENNKETTENIVFSSTTVFKPENKSKDYIASTAMNNEETSTMDIKETTLETSINKNDKNKITDMTIHEIFEEMSNEESYSENSNFTEKMNVTTTERTTAKIMTSPKTVATFKNLQPPVCNRSVCNLAASRILNLMNHSTSSCEDFYEFACGGESREKYADDRIFENILSTHLSDVNKSSAKYLKAFWGFFDSCMSFEEEFHYTETLQYIKKLVEATGTFVVDNQSLNYSMTDLFAQLILRQSMPLFDVGLDIDKQNYILQLTLPEESVLKSGIDNWSALFSHKRRCLDQQKFKFKDNYLNLNDIYMSYMACQRNYTKFLDLMDEILREISNHTQFDLNEIRFTVEFNILNLLHKFLLPPNNIKKALINHDYTLKKISELQTLYPFLQWKRLFELLTGRKIPEDTVIQLYFENYFSQIFRSLAKVDEKKLNNGLLAFYVKVLYENLVIPKTSLKPENFCLKQSMELMPDISTYLFKSVYPKKDYDYQKKTVMDLFKILKSNLEKSLKQVDWLDDESKELMLAKNRNIKLEFFDLKDFNLDYESFTVSNYQENFMNLLVKKRRNIYQLANKPFTSNSIFQHFLNPLSKSPLSFYSAETIVVPPGLAQSAHAELPGYLVVARVGLHLAREIGHFFSSVAIRNYTTLPKTVEPTYVNMESSMSHLLTYSSPRLFGVQNVTFKIDSSLSNEERIADNIGFRLVVDSFNALGKDKVLPWISMTYSKEEIFFISLAQEYCRKIDLVEFMVNIFESKELPPMLRVENVMGNSFDFVEKFSCPDGSGMNMYVEKFQFPYLIKFENYEEM